MGRQAGPGTGAALADRTLWVACLGLASRTACPKERAQRLLSYLAVFPTGLHNRTAAEEVERCLDQLAEDPTRAELQARLRSLRDPHMPPIVASELPPDRTPSAPC